MDRTDRTIFIIGLKSIEPSLLSQWLLPPGDVAHVGQMVSNAFVAIDAGLLTRKQEALVRLNCARALARDIHRLRAVAVAAFEGIVSLHARPFMFRELRRWSRNFSRVLMVPKSLPHTSFEACILRAILSVHSCGTWQSGQWARTPDRWL